MAEKSKDSKKSQSIIDKMINSVFGVKQVKKLKTRSQKELDKAGQ